MYSPIITLITQITKIYGQQLILTFAVPEC